MVLVSNKKYCDECAKEIKLEQNKIWKRETWNKNKEQYRNVTVLLTWY